MLTGGVMYEAYKKQIPVVLAGSIRDDGPIPDVITDVVECQRAMRRYVPQIGMALMVLHAAALDRGRQSVARRRARRFRVDINPSSVTKLTDRGSHQTLGIVMDASSFLRELTLRDSRRRARSRTDGVCAVGRARCRIDAGDSRR